MKYNKVKFQYKIYKKYMSDIWGIYRSKMRNVKYLASRIPRMFWREITKQQELRRLLNKRYRFRLDLPHPLLKPRDFKRDFRLITWRLIKYYYIYVNYKKFKKYRILARTMNGPFLGNYLIFLECRISYIMYRIGIFTNPFTSKDMIKRGFISLNGKIILDLNYPMKLFDFFIPVSTTVETFNWTIDAIEDSYRMEYIWSSIPNYLFIDIDIFYICLIRYPLLTDLHQTAYIDIFRGTQYLW